MARYLFHFSNIYETYAILLKHFFENIIICYQIYKDSISNLRRKTKNTNNINTYDAEELDEIQKRLNKFINHINKIPQIYNHLLNFSLN